MKPGNLYSKPAKMHIDPKSPQSVRISLDSRIPSLEDQDKAAAAAAGRTWSADEHADHKWVKHIRIQSGLLTKFW